MPMNAYESITLEFQSGFISGMLAGKSLNCLVNPSQGSVPAGVYQIQPPMDDVVFGQLAVMTPVGRADGGAVSGAYEFSGASASSFDKAIKMVGPGGASESIASSASAGDFIKFVGPGHGAASFVLSSRPIPGRNCLVISSNFADFMDALKSTGGATVRFA